jgi:aarF domain-containing kinase
MWSHYSHAAESESARTSSDAARGTASPSAVEKPDSLREKDLIGFSAVSGEEGEKDFKHLLETSSKVNMRERSIPSSQLSRLVGFGGLGARMAAGLAFETVFGGGSSQQGGSSLSDENAERLAETLCRMRGAALKLGQMLSVQDEGMLPPALARALERVKQNADYMPAKQLNEVLGGELGSAWRFRFREFHDKPIAAASIGQVHKAVLKDGTIVAVKVQYPGVAQSIGSDLANLKTLVTMTNLVPRVIYR